MAVMLAPGICCNESQHLRPSAEARTGVGPDHQPPSNLPSCSRAKICAVDCTTHGRRYAFRNDANYEDAVELLMWGPRAPCRRRVPQADATHSRHQAELKARRAAATRVLGSFLRLML
jgi:hypothetical protein